MSDLCVLKTDIEVGTIAISLLTLDIQPDCGNASGSITIQATATDPEVSITATWSDGVTGLVRNNLAGGTYTVTLATSDGGCTINEEFTVPNPSNIQATTGIAVTGCVCEGQPSAAIQALNQGASGYTFHWEGPEGYTSTEQNPQDMTLAGAYTVVMADGTGCTATHTRTVPACSPMQLTFDVHPDCGGMGGDVAAQVTGGAPGLLVFQWAAYPGYDAPQLNNVPAGTYALTVTDREGCTVSGQAVMPAIDAPGFMLDADITPACTPLGGSIALDMAGVAQPYTVAWAYPYAPPTPTLAQLNGGTYQVTVTDANGCIEAGQFRVPSGPVLQAQTTVPTCNSSSNGSINLSISGSAENTITWEGHPDWTGRTSLQNLPPGNYCVRVTSPEGCTAEACYDLRPQAPQAYYPYLRRAQIKASTGAILYDAQWVPSSQGCLVLQGGQQPIAPALRTAMQNGTVTWTVALWFSEDVQYGNCTYALPNGTQDGALISNASANSPFSFQVQSQQVTAIANAANYTFELRVAAVTAQGLATLDMRTFSNNGIHCVDLPGLDPATCAWRPTVGAALTGPDATHRMVFECGLSMDVVVEGNTFWLDFGQGLGRPTSDVRTISWTNSLGQRVSTAAYFTPASGRYGTYCVAVRTRNGCTIQRCVEYCKAPPFSVTETIKDVDCLEDADGWICLDSDADPPLRYNWSTGATGACVYGLAPGEYCVTLTSTACDLVAGFPKKYCFTVGLNGKPLELAAIHSTPSCAGGSTGSLCAYPDGGTPPYALTWYDGSTSNCLSNLPPGCHAYTLRDACGTVVQGCVEVGVVDSRPPSIAVVDDQSGCSGLTLRVVGASAPYLLTLLDPQSGGSYTYSGDGDTFRFEGISSGTYALQATDRCGYTYQLGNFFVAPSMGSRPVLGTPSYTYECGTATLQIAITADAYPVQLRLRHLGSGQIYETLSGGQATLTGLPSGTYQWYAVDACGVEHNYGSSTLAVPDDGVHLQNLAGSYACRAAVVFDLVAGVAPFDIIVDETSGGGSFVQSGGLGEYLFEGVSPGTYTIRVKDACGRSFNLGTVEAGVETGEAPPLMELLDAQDVCNGAAEGTLQWQSTGGNPPFLYTLVNLDIPGFSVESDQPNFGNLPPGAYSLYAEDACGSTYDVGGHTLRSADFSIRRTYVLPSCEGASIGSIFLYMAGGNISMPQYSYLWSNGATTAAVNALPAGQYTVTVTETTSGCSIAQSIEVGVAEITLTGSAIFGESTFFNPATQQTQGLADGVIAITARFGDTNRALRYRWSNGAEGRSVEGLSAGTYSVTVTTESGSDCPTVFTFEVGTCSGAIPGIDYVNTRVTRIAPGQPGSIDLELLAGGNEPLHYVWQFQDPNTLQWTTVGDGQDISGLTQYGTYQVSITDDCLSASVYETFKLQKNCPDVHDPEITIQNDCMDEESGPSAFIFNDLHGGHYGEILVLEWSTGETGVYKRGVGLISGTDRVVPVMLPNGIDPSSPSDVLWGDSKTFSLTIRRLDGCPVIMTSRVFSNNNAQYLLLHSSCRDIETQLTTQADVEGDYFGDGFYLCRTCGVTEVNGQITDYNCYDFNTSEEGRPVVHNLVFVPNPEGSVPGDNECQRGGELYLDYSIRRNDLGSWDDYREYIGRVFPNSTSIFFDEGDSNDCGCLFDFSSYEFGVNNVFPPDCYDTGALLYAVSSSCLNEPANELPDLPAADDSCSEYAYQEGLYEGCPALFIVCNDDDPPSLVSEYPSFIFPQERCRCPPRYGIDEEEAWEVFVCGPNDECPVATLTRPWYTRDLPECEDLFYGCDVCEQAYQIIDRLSPDGGEEGESRLDSNGSMSEFSTTIFPNPNEGAFTAEAFMPERGSLEIILSNMDGREIFRTLLPDTEGAVRVNFTLDGGVRPGLYTVTFITGTGQAKTERLLLMRE